MAYFIPDPNKMGAAGIPTKANFSSASWVNGFEMNMVDQITGITSFTIAPGSCRALTSDFVISYDPSSGTNLPPLITVDTTSVGINGCYPHPLSALALTNTTVFCVYAVANSSGVGIPVGQPTMGVVVATSDAFLPPNYDSYFRIGLIAINVNTTIRPWVQVGSGAARYYNLSQPYNITTTVPLTLTAYDLTINNGPVPPRHQGTVKTNVTLTNTVDGQPVRFTPYDLNESQVFVRTPVGQIAVSQDLVTGVNALGNSTLSIYGASSGQTLVVDLIGFADELRNAVF